VVLGAFWHKVHIGSLASIISLRRRQLVPYPREADEPLVVLHARVSVAVDVWAWQ
jgi:hypothetical protein